MYFSSLSDFTNCHKIFLLFCFLCLRLKRFHNVFQVKRKKAAHAGMLDIAKTANRPMIHIGG